MIVLHVLSVILHITFSLGSVSSIQLCLEFTDLLEELTENRIHTVAVISHVTTEKDICKLMPLLE